MKKFFVAALLLTAPYTMHAQFGGLLDKAKSKVKQRIDNKTNKAMDDALDEVEGKKAPAQAAEEKGVATTASQPAEKEVAPEKDAAPEKERLTSYTKFDFIPGEKILYNEDFASDVLAELPVTWNASGKGEVTTINNKTGKWLRGFQGMTYLSGNKSSFGENYTIEFDMIYFYQPKQTGYLLPDIAFGFFSSGTTDNTDNSFLENRHGINAAEVVINGAAVLNSYKKNSSSFHSDRATIDGFEANHNKVLHYSVQVQKQRFRMWVNQNKLFDIPRAIHLGDTMNQLFFHMESSNYKDDEVGFYVSNIKVATGVADTRHKLIEEGKFSTTGILFDPQSAAIKQESYGVIKDIAGVLKENTTVNVKVVGHTSSDGDDAANLELSKQRSASVKDLLVKEYGIEEARIKTEGKGETQPVADNKTKEGKAQNRRVEFIKL
jgi:outer membrane protein OmpA-like peptidoglycan-associated protein